MILLWIHLFAYGRSMATPRHLSAHVRDRLKEARDRQGITQRQLAAAVGVARYSITRMEQGRHPLPLALCEDLARALGVHPAWLCFGVISCAPESHDGKAV